MLAVINMETKRIEYYDSLGHTHWNYLHDLFRYVQDEHKALFKTDMDVKEWQLVPCQRNLPLQRNGKKYGSHPICTCLLILLLTSVNKLIGYDCGVFLCMYADFISNDNPIIFTQSEIDVCRERIALSIMRNMALD